MGRFWSEEQIMELQERIQERFDHITERLDRDDITGYALVTIDSTGKAVHMESIGDAAALMTYMDVNKHFVQDRLLTEMGAKVVYTDDATLDNLQPKATAVKDPDGELN